MYKKGCLKNSNTFRNLSYRLNGKQLRSKAFFWAVLIMILATVISNLPSVLSSQVSTFVIGSAGQILGAGVLASSGSSQDIQAAVDTVNAAGGGTVHVPAGTFEWSSGATVTVYGGVNVIGASDAGCSGHPSFTEYSGSTILKMSVESANDMFVLDGSNGKPSRISGIVFNATSPTGTSTCGCAIKAFKSKDFRIDHCTFINFKGMSVFVTNVYEGDAYGVVDHCVIRNPYKLVAPDDWAYGFYVQGRATWWNDITAPLTNFLGKYPVQSGFPVLYVEDCKTSYCRHAVDAIQGGWIVARYNYFDHPYPTNYAQLNVHGSGDGAWPSCRGFEFYSNTVVGEASASYAETCWLRGGAGVVYDNTFTNVKSGGCGVLLSNETCPTQPDEVLHDVWIWDNTIDAGIAVNNASSSYFVEDVDYFLRAPNNIQDGFAYTPFPYPHYLALED